MAEIYGYVRVSTKEQKEERQLEVMKQLQILEKNIFIEKISGKDFNRPIYQKMVKKLKKNDLLYIKSIDRLGRNYTEIREQWNYIINDIGADIVVLDMPLLDTRKSDDNLDKKFIADLVLQILSYVAQKELENTRRRQKQGMDVMPVINGKKTSLKTGKPVGRPNAQFPENWKECYEKWRCGEVTAVKCMDRLNLKRSTFYKLVKIYEKDMDKREN